MTEQQKSDILVLFLSLVLYKSSTVLYLLCFLCSLHLYYTLLIETFKIHSVPYTQITSVDNMCSQCSFCLHNTTGYWFIFSSSFPMLQALLPPHWEQQSLGISSVLPPVLVSHLLFPTTEQKPKSWELQGNSSRS